jgi:hypothetical protein
MKIDNSQLPQARAADPTLTAERKQVQGPDLLAAKQNTPASEKMRSSPELRIARGGDSLEISAAGRALLEESLRQQAKPADVARKAAQEARTGKTEAQTEKPPGEVPNLLLARK